jgi:hypothetical protein
MTALTTTDNIARLAANFTSKVTADDITNTDSKLHAFLTEFAAEYVNTYTGTFAFMLNMRGWVNFGLSDAQVAGVVNCALNDYHYAQKQAAVQEATTIVAHSHRTHLRSLTSSTWQMAGTPWLVRRVATAHCVSPPLTTTAPSSG